MTRLYRIGCVAALLLAVPVPGQAQSAADTYFHEAARQYVTDNVPAARRAVEQGLQVAPSDPRLLALQKKLREGSRPDRPDPEDNASGSQSGGQQNKNASSNQSSNGGDTPSSKQSGAARTGSQESARSRPGGPRPSDRSRRDSEREAEAPSASGGRPADRPARADTVRRGRGGHGRAAPLSRAQAERLLRALEGQERQLLRQLRRRSSSQQPTGKDW